MTDLFNRDFFINIGGQVITSRSASDYAEPTLKASFKVEKTLDKNPNKLELSIWNLSKTFRSLFQINKVGVILEAGYVGFTNQIFAGEVLTATISRQGVDTILKIQAADGLRNFTSKRINKRFDPKTAVVDVLKEAVSAMGVGEGNLADVLSAGSSRDKLKQFNSGVVLSGKASDQVDKIVKGMGYTYSIQDNQIQILKNDQVARAAAIVLASDSGLIGSPELGEKGVLTCKCLLNGAINVGRKLEIKSREVNGFFKTTKVVHSGDTWGGEWTSDVEGNRYG